MDQVAKDRIAEIGKFLLAIAFGATLNHLISKAYYEPPLIAKAEQTEVLTNEAVLLNIVKVAGEACKHSSATLDTAQIDFACFPPRLLPQKPKQYVAQGGKKKKKQ